ncbi:uncharacterized protein LOC143207289 [Lasioglossum baleicum]|uniref:uncharacterized protein LOC143207289 n=1 Tax=Lasioglossum baleicum TaxID=434251 RepID=UPI003FCCE1E5
METRLRYLEEQLQRRESEVSELRTTLREVGAKFVQLEQAFKTNLRLQVRREARLDRLKREGQELRTLNGDALQTRTELSSRLMNTIIERDHWKNTFLQQREFVMRNEIEYKDAIASVKQECEDILKVSRETAEKQFHELIELYHGTREKVNQLEEEIGMYQSCRREYENRTFELANLLETLNRFDVNVGSVCQLAAEALKNLTEPGNLFEGSMKSLRHVAWTTRDREDQTKPVLLEQQNAVLKEVVKSLKKKLQAQQQSCDQVPEKETKYQNCSTSREANTSSRNSNENLPSRFASPENEDFGKSVMQENKNHEFTDENKSMNACDRVLCIESHSNGRSYEEYIFKLSINREMKLKCPVVLNNSEAIVRMEFVDNEAEYERAPLDRIIIFFNHIYASVNVKQTGIPCGTQTTRLRTVNRSTQTAVVGIKSFLRLNAGTTVSKQIYMYIYIYCSNSKPVVQTFNNGTFAKRLI